MQILIQDFFKTINRWRKIIRKNLELERLKKKRKFLNKRSLTSSITGLAETLIRGHLNLKIKSKMASTILNICWHKTHPILIQDAILNQVTNKEAFLNRIINKYKLKRIT